VFEHGEKVKQRQLTIHVACSYIDSLLHQQWTKEKEGSELQTPQNEKQRKTKLELQGIMCLMLASKYDELDDRIPLIREL
jgi:Cyclin, N-terminal domain